MYLLNLLAIISNLWHLTSLKIMHWKVEPLRQWRICIRIFSKVQIVLLNCTRCDLSSIERHFECLSEISTLEFWIEEYCLFCHFIQLDVTFYLKDSLSRRPFRDHWVRVYRLLYKIRLWLEKSSYLALRWRILNFHLETFPIQLVSCDSLPLSRFPYI